MFYKNMEEFKQAFQDGRNLQWIQHELQSVAEPPPANSAASPSHKQPKPLR
jgi:hypothetical protein